MSDFVILNIPQLVRACHRNMLPWAMSSTGEPKKITERIKQSETQNFHSDSHLKH